MRQVDLVRLIHCWAIVAMEIQLLGIGEGGEETILREPKFPESVVAGEVVWSGQTWHFRYAC